LLYGGLFLLAGVLLLGLNVIFFRHNQSYTKLRLLEAARADPVLRQSLSRLGNLDVQERINRADRNTAEHNLIVSSLEGLGVMVVISGGLGWLIAGRILRPITAITAAAKAASEHNLNERVGLEGPDDELKNLADTFDSLMIRLDAAFAAQRRFVANASHELRTPLAIMRTAIDVTLAKPDRTPAQLEAMATKVRAATERAERLVGGLLVLARSDRGIDARETLNLAAVAKETVDLFAADAEGDAIRIHTMLSPTSTTGDAALLQRMVENLVENAIRHNNAQGYVEIATSTVDDRAILTIANTGPEIEDREVDSLFEPFRRKNAARTQSDRGIGLGLSIVASVVTAHDGRVEARPRPGGGLIVTVDLVAARQPPTPPGGAWRDGDPRMARAIRTFGELSVAPKPGHSRSGPFA
jgi:signal transduction histidine kinase